MLQHYSKISAPFFSLLFISLFSGGCKKNDSGTAVPDTFAKVMIVHANVDAGAVDFFLAGSKINTDSIVYGKNTPYTTTKLSTNKTPIKIGLTKLGTFLYNDSLNLKADAGYTFYVAQDSTPIKPTIVLLTTDDLSAPTAGNCKIRFVHLVSDALTFGFDVELAVPGAAASAKSLFSNLRFKSILQNFALNQAGTYDILVKTSGTTNVLAKIPNVKLEDGKIYTIVARGKTANVGTSFINNN